MNKVCFDLKYAQNISFYSGLHLTEQANKQIKQNYLQTRQDKKHQYLKKKTD